MYKIFVGNLNPATTEDAVRLLFARHAEVEDVALPVDAATGKPRGFAIVMIRDEIRAKGAMIALRGARLDGRSLVINPARKKGQPPPPKRDRRSSSRYRAYGAKRGGSRPGGYGGYGGGAGGGERGSFGSGGTGGASGQQRGYGNRPNFGSNRPRRDQNDRGGPSTPRNT